MVAYAHLLQSLLKEGRVVLTKRPVLPSGPRLVIDVLEQAHAIRQLDLAGPPLAFDRDAALAAARVTLDACWFLCNRTEPASEVESSLQLPPPATPAAHLAGDLTLGFLGEVSARARLMGETDLLIERLATILRQWPLSGVSSNVAECPLTPLDFGGHPGLLLLYAERLAANAKPAWVPGPAKQAYVELLFRELGRPVPTPIEREPTA